MITNALATDWESTAVFCFYYFPNTFRAINVPAWVFHSLQLLVITLPGILAKISHIYWGVDSQL